jgi:phage regulator Rha-like protein
MSELVLLHHNEPMTTTETLAEGVKLAHKTVIQLVRKYLADLSEWGEIAFQMRLNPQGKPTEYAWLNETQAVFLMTLMRNSPVVVAFKKALVSAFMELRDRLAVSPAPTFETRQLSHGADLAVAADRTFRSFLRSARSSGLRLPDALRRANAQTVTRTGMDMLGALGVTLPEADDYAPDNHGVAEFGAVWLAGGLPLPATVCRSSDLYAAYMKWRRPSSAVAINQFFGQLLRAHPQLDKCMLHAKGGEREYNLRAVVVGDVMGLVEPGTVGRYIATETDRFSVALADWLNAA